MRCIRGVPNDKSYVTYLVLLCHRRCTATPLSTPDAPTSATSRRGTSASTTPSDHGGPCTSSAREVPPTPNRPNKAPIQVGNAQIAEANTPLAEQHQRVEMKYNKINNLLLFGCILVPFITFPAFYHYRLRYLWTSWSDPYALPQGFDPNRDPPPKIHQEIPAPKPMMSGSAPGSFNVKPTSWSTSTKEETRQ